MINVAFSALTLLVGGRKGIRPVKIIRVVGCWCGCLSGLWSEVQTCIMAQLMPLPPTVSCFSKIQIGFTFLALGHLCSPGQRAVKRVCALMIHTICCCCARLYTMYVSVNHRTVLNRTV